MIYIKDKYVMYSYKMSVNKIMDSGVLIGNKLILSKLKLLTSLGLL